MVPLGGIAPILFGNLRANHRTAVCQFAPRPAHLAAPRHETFPCYQTRHHAIPFSADDVGIVIPDLRLKVLSKFCHSVLISGNVLTEASLSISQKNLS